MSSITSKKLQFVRLGRKGHVLFVTIDRPDVLNALHPPAHHELAHVFDDYAADPDLWVAVISATGSRAFCVGNDLKYSTRTGEDAFPSTGFGGITKRYDLFKPVIAAVNGMCLGGGLEIVLACDIAISSADAQFGLPEPHIGHAAIGGAGLHRLVRQVSFKNAMWIALRAQRISAAQALQAGLINEVVSSSELATRAHEIAEEITECSPLAIQATKQVLLMTEDDNSFAASVARQYPAVDTLIRSDDAREGIDAFVAKRKPRWRGR